MWVYVKLEVGESNKERCSGAGVFTPERYTLLNLSAEESVHIIGHAATGCNPDTCEHKTVFLQRADRCTSYTISVCPSVSHIPVFCPDEQRYDRLVFSFR